MFKQLKSYIYIFIIFRFPSEGDIIKMYAAGMEPWWVWALKTYYLWSGV